MVETRSSKFKKSQEKNTFNREASPKRAFDTTILESTKHVHTDDTTNEDSLVKNSEIFGENEMILSNIRSYLLSKASKKYAAYLAKYLRIAEYGEGDVLIGVRAPEIRALSKSLGFLPFLVLKNLIKSKYHEERLLAVINMKEKYKNSNDLVMRERIFNFFVEERKGINNWDLVDSSASQIVGAHLRDNPNLKRSWLFDKLVKSTRLWDRRIAIVATQNFISHGEYEDTLELASTLLYDKEDLIHKATGWTLREMGKMSKETLVKFLDQHAQNMPRIMLRYSIEKFSVQERKLYMNIGKKS
ncbi:8658_t:CDS:2 [Acaulospora morrowiae]|uniref:8658_t:CDS:1 n=1 Tax=Acaulospora morrowiae TaxID=94023 RepID=A0A9N9C365_9GLOM|nr:8658_t:CDS:2 [Acaulospora morrowiae]